MSYFEIDGVNFSQLISTMKIGYKTLTTDSTNASGSIVVDVINKKVSIEVGLRHTTDDEMKVFLSAIDDYVCEISYRDSKTGIKKTINAKVSAPEPEYYTIQDGFIIYKPMSVSFEEL